MKWRSLSLPAASLGLLALLLPSRTLAEDEAPAGTVDFARQIADYVTERGIGLLIPVNVNSNPGNPALALANVLVSESLEDPFARMALLLRDPLVGLEDLMNDRNVRPDHRSISLGPLALFRWLFVREDLLNRAEVQFVLPRRLAATHPANQHVTADSYPKVHVGDHSFPS